MARFVALAVIFAGLLASGLGVQAGINPFKKTKNYVFGKNIAWHLKEDGASKSGSVKKNADTLYYHLNISKDRLRLRLGKNDPSGELENTRELSKVSIVDVLLDGRRFSAFQNCLDNQEQISKKLKPGALVANGGCINPGTGDFIIQLDLASKDALKASKNVELIVEPYGRAVKLKYSMSGFADIINKLDKPKPKLAAKAKPKTRPIAKIKAKPKKKKLKMCLAKPPADFKSAVRALSYPCDNSAKKARAEKSIAALVEREKQKMTAEMAKIEQENKAREKAGVSNEIETAWAKKQAAMWIKRCNRHWSKGTSPCFCEKYLSSAPPNVTNTCGK